MKKLKIQTPDITKQNIEQIAKLFPNVLTETKDEAGHPKKAIDFDLLKQCLSDVVVDDENERYRLDWPSKKAALLKANTPITKTLRPCRAESVHFDTTENVYIEGDNFEVLKILQESYLGKIKMIYIDPPYNTGKDFIYKDNFKVSKAAYEEEIGAIDEDGDKLFKNTDSNGRFHSDWLSMMYERLVVARDLLKDDGVIFISIDDNEVHNLRKICDEIFGEENFISQFIHKNNSSKNQAKLVSVSAEYFYCFAKNKNVLKSLNWRIKKKGAQDIASLFNKLKKQGISVEEIDIQVKEMYQRPKYAHLSRWNKVDEKGVFKDADLSREGGAKSYTIINPHTSLPCVIPNRGWGKSENELKRLQEQDLIWYGSEYTPPGLKDYINPNDVSVPDNFWYYDNSVDTRWCKTEFGKLIFENPKPLEMLKNMIEMVDLKNDKLIIDFFSGSSTTAHAVMQLNAEDNGKRKFIMVQLPEQTAEKSEAYKAGYKTIAEIGKERIRRAGKKIIEDKEGIENLDIGFRVYKTDSTNMKDVYYHPEKLGQKDLFDSVSNIKKDRSPDDLLTQVILDLGLALNLPIEKKEILGNTVFIVQTNALVACFDDQINFEIIDRIADLSPFKVVFKDACFTDDKDRINVEERFKRFSPETMITVI